MKVTARFGVVLSIVFALFCLYTSFDGFSHLDALADEAQRADRRGYAYFWLFLGMIAVACALVSRWIVQRENTSPSD